MKRNGDNTKKRQRQWRENDEEKRRQRGIKREHLKSDDSDCQEVLYGVASIYCEDPYLTRDVYRVADTSADCFDYYTYDNPSKPVYSVEYNRENMLNQLDEDRAWQSTEKERFKRKTVKQYEEDKRDIMKGSREIQEENRVLKNLDVQNKKEIDGLYDDLADSLNLTGALKIEMFGKERELAEHKEKISELESTLCKVQSKLTELEEEGRENKTKLEETEVEKWELRMKIVEMHGLLTQNDKEKSSWLKTIEDTDGKLAEMNRNLMITNKNTADLSNALTERDELLEQLKREHKMKLKEAEVESMNLKMKNVEMEKEYSSLLKIVKDKDDKLAEMCRNLSIINNRTSYLSKTLAEKDDLLEELKKEHRTKLDEAEVESINLKLKITNKDKEYSSLLKIVKDKDDELADMYRNIGNANHITAELSRTIKDKDEVLDKLQRTLKEKEIETTYILESLAHREMENFELSRNITLNDEEIAELWRMLVEKEEIS